MTRKHFKQFAESLVKSDSNDHVITAAIVMLKASNPRFDEVRFWAYIEKLRGDK